MTKLGFKETEIGMIPEDWEENKLGELITHKKGFAFKSIWYRNKGKRIIKVSDFTDRSVNLSNCVFIDEQKSDEFKEYKLKEDDIVIATVGSWPNNPASIVGKVIKIPKKASESLLNQNAVIIRSKNKTKTNQKFLFYRLRDKDFSDYLIAGAQGSANQASITLNDIFSFEFGLPNHNEQIAIAKILSDLDSKIELNQQMNKTLEEIGQAIFKRWFVDFEFPNEKGMPYKSSGGEMVDSELGKIPKGERVVELGEVIKFVKGKKPTELFEECIGDTLPQILIENLNGISPLFADKSNMTIVNEDDVIMVMDGASSGRVERGHKGILGSTLAKIECKNRLNNSFIYYFLRILQEDIKQNTTGTSIPHADKGKIEKYKTIVPEKSILLNLEKISNIILHKIIHTKQESINLSQIRDSLLPKLMSGKIRVPVEVGA